jgi:hypothetical protein
VAYAVHGYGTRHSAYGIVPLLVVTFSYYTEAAERNSANDDTVSLSFCNCIPLPPLDHISLPLALVTGEG